MKILIYIELYPIRENKLEYYNVARNFANSDLNKRADVRFVANDDIRLRLKKECCLNETQFLPITDKLKNWIAENDRVWDEEAIAKWKKYKKSTNNAVLIEYLSEVRLSLYEFDTVIVWGKNDTIRHLAKNLNFNIVFAELTPSRSPFFEGVFFSYSGVNGEHVIGGNLHQEISAPIFDKKESVLLALQLFDDANFQLFSPFREFRSLIDDVKAKFPSAKYNLFIKRHPYSHLRKINKEKEDLAIEYAVNIGFKEYKTKDKYFLTKFDNIVSVNSSVCFEGALLGKKVYILGDSCYKGAIISFKHTTSNDSDLVNSNKHFTGKKIAQSAENFCQKNFYKWEDCAKFFTDKSQEFEKSPFLLPLHRLIGEKIKRKNNVIYIRNNYFNTEKQNLDSSNFRLSLNRKCVYFDRNDSHQSSKVLLLEIQKNRIVSGATFSANTSNYTIKSFESDYLLLVGYSFDIIKLIEVNHENHLF